MATNSAIRVRVALIASVVAVNPAIALAAEPLIFEPTDIISWDKHSFSGYTDYQLTQTPTGEPAVYASCEQGTASGLFLREAIDLTKTPIVEWRWRVREGIEGNNEQSKSGDDYPARVYAVDEHKLFIWRTRAINYVWSSQQQSGSSWDNAYASQATMVALRGADDFSDEWRTERRNLREDFRQFHDRELTELSAFAIMTDCDNTKQKVSAWYGEIRFLPEE
ncbi:MAG: DUF3047 domain-containing protein [Idiomarina sp.]